MLSLRRIKIGKIKSFLGKLPRILAENGFLTFLILFFIFLIVSGIIFYRCGILAKEENPEAFEKPLLFKEKTYQSILQIWQERKERFEGADAKEYQNPF